jgi:hypothetical protein
MTTGMQADIKIPVEFIVRFKYLTAITKMEKSSCSVN